MPSFYPPQVGFLPTGVNGTAQTSTLYFGRDIDASYDAIGFGQGGRPDYLSIIQIPLVSRAMDGTLTKQGTLTLDVGALVSGRMANPNMPTDLNLILKEVAVCDAGQNRRAVVLMSETYDPT
jgi:hypothetical protein